jgi:hypothetical protein
MPVRALTGARGLWTQDSSHGSNGVLNLAEFVLKFSAPLMQSFYDVHEPSGSGLYPVPVLSEHRDRVTLGGQIKRGLSTPVFDGLTAERHR